MFTLEILKTASPQPISDLRLFKEVLSEIQKESDAVLCPTTGGCGFIEKPFFIQFIMGILGGIQPSAHNLLHMKNTADRLFGKDYLWSVLAVGQYQFSYGMVAAAMGGNVRFGMEDNLYLSKGKLLKSNEESVLKIRRIIEDLSMEIALPDEVRQMLKLK